MSRLEEVSDTSSVYTDFESESDASSVRDSSPLGGLRSNNNNLSISERVSNRDTMLLSGRQQDKYAFEERKYQRSGETITTQQAAPQTEESKSELVTQQKNQYVDAIIRVNYHLRDAINNQPFFITERVNKWLLQQAAIQLGRPGEEMSLTPRDLERAQFNLEDLFKKVLEDDRE